MTTPARVVVLKPSRISREGVVVSGAVLPGPSFVFGAPPTRSGVRARASCQP
jgi:hypothetical protein